MDQLYFLDMSMNSRQAIRLAVSIALCARRDLLDTCLKVPGLADSAGAFARDIVSLERLSATVYGSSFPSL